MLKRGLQFTPAHSLRRPDYIKSSTAREEGNSGFIPSYELEKEKVSIAHLMANYYMRKWFQERDEFQKERAIYHPSSKNEKDILRRRHVQRVLRHRKEERNLPTITLKRFAKVSRRPKAQVDPESLRYNEKYKVECYPEAAEPKQPKESKESEGPKEPNKPKEKQLSGKNGTVSSKSRSSSSSSSPSSVCDNATPRSVRSNQEEKKEENLEKQPPAGVRRIKCMKFCPYQALDVCN